MMTMAVAVYSVEKAAMYGFDPGTHESGWSCKDPGSRVVAGPVIEVGSPAYMVPLMLGYTGARIGHVACAGRTGGGHVGPARSAAGSAARRAISGPARYGCRRPTGWRSQVRSTWPASAGLAGFGFLQLMPLLAGGVHRPGPGLLLRGSVTLGRSDCTSCRGASASTCPRARAAGRATGTPCGPTRPVHPALVVMLATVFRGRIIARGRARALRRAEESRRHRRPAGVESRTYSRGFSKNKKKKKKKSGGDQRAVQRQPTTSAHTAFGRRGGCRWA